MDIVLSINQPQSDPSVEAQRMKDTGNVSLVR